MILSALLALTLADARAEPSYRALELADGRAFVAEVLATRADGLRVRTPQGTLALPFDVLRDMQPSDLGAFEAQPVWTVHVAAPDAHHDALVEALSAVPAVEVYAAHEAAGGLSEAAAARAVACGLDVDCLVDAWSDEPWRIVVVAFPEGGALRVLSAVSTGSVLHRTDVSPADPLGPLARPLLGLEAPLPSPAPLAAQPAVLRPPPSPDLVFAPVPGLHALRRGDHAAFATALGIALPTTAVWVGAVGRNAQSAPEAVALSLAGFYVSTVVANQLTSSRRR